MGDDPRDNNHFRPTSWEWLELGLTAAVSAWPLVAEARPVTWAAPYTSAAVSWAAKAGAAAVLFLVIAVPARKTWPFAAFLAVLAAVLTAVHWHVLDSLAVVADWQRDLYLGILNHTADPPHVFRPLPYGFVRSLERLTGDWEFSCLAYRWFFTSWFLRAAYRLARLWHGPAMSLLPVLAVAALYQQSIQHYWGQLTDPVNHALFVMAVLAALEDRWLLMTAALAVAVPAKETVVLLVPAYLAVALGPGRGGHALMTTAIAAGACVAAFLAVRLPLGWRPGNEAMNGLPGLMIGTNLGLGEPVAASEVPLYENYLQPALFVGVFLPPIALGWRRIDGQLRRVVLVVTPLLLLSNLGFGWMYESRNYMPLVPLLATAALPHGRGGDSRKGA